MGEFPGYTRRALGLVLVGNVLLAVAGLLAWLGAPGLAALLLAILGATSLLALSWAWRGRFEHAVGQDAAVRLATTLYLFAVAAAAALYVAVTTTVSQTQQVSDLGAIGPVLVLATVAEAAAAARMVWPVSTRAQRWLGGGFVVWSVAASVWLALAAGHVSDDLVLRFGPSLDAESGTAAIVVDVFVAEVAAWWLVVLLAGRALEATLVWSVLGRLAQLEASLARIEP